jgi:hypothetical protein
MTRIWYALIARTPQFRRLTRMQCLGVSSPANDAVASVYSCTDASVHLDWTFVQPGDNLSLQLMGTNLYVLPLCPLPPSR